MGLAFEVDLRPSRTALRLARAGLLLAAGSLAMGAGALLGGPTALVDEPAPWRLAAGWLAAAAAAGLPLAGWRRRPGAGSAGAPRRLEVGERGEIRITPGAGAQLCGACRLPGLIVLVLAPYPRERPRARTLHLVLGRDAMGGDAWRRLNRWLRWMQRGQHLAG
jgi:hypothetical protein